MAFLYIPYFYFVKTRIAGRLQALSWVFVYFGPVVIFWLLYDNTTVCYLILSYYAINLVYENGYIQNDVVTTKKEKEPTLRLSENALSYARLNIVKIYLCRTSVLGICLYLLFVNASWAIFLFFIGVVCTLQILFFTYNLFRSRINLYMIIPLAGLRFYGPMLPVMFFAEDHLSVFLLLFLYPVPKFLEFTMQPRYRMRKLRRFIGDVDRFRVVYYFFSSAFFLAFYFVGFHQLLFVCVVSLFYFIYRFVAYLVIIKNEGLRKAVVAGAKEDYRK